MKNNTLKLKNNKYKFTKSIFHLLYFFFYQINELRILKKKFDKII